MCKTDFDFSNGKKKCSCLDYPQDSDRQQYLTMYPVIYSILCMNETSKSVLISDVVNTGALDEISVNSPLILKLISGNEFENFRIRRPSI